MKSEIVTNLESKVINTQVLFDLPKWQEIFGNEIRDEAKSQAVTSITRTANDLDIQLSVTDYDNEINEMVNYQVELVKESVFNTHKDLKEKVTTLLQTPDLNQADLTDLVINETSEYFDDVYTQSKATQIVQNTSTYIENKSKYEIAVKRQLKKVWVTRRDRKVRPSHAELDGITLNANGTFTLESGNNTNIARFPKDTGDPSEDVNCRCILRLSK